MALEKLDRQQWRFDEAVDYVAEIISAEKSVAEEKVLEPAYGAPWLQEPAPTDRARAIARNELLVALRDGDLHATGRLSTMRANHAAPPYTEWTLHSGHGEPISPAQWRSGEFRTGRLRLIDGEFIDIRLPRFMVRAIWPKTKQSPAPQGTGYSTPLSRSAARSDCRVRHHRGAPAEEGQSRRLVPHSAQVEGEIVVGEPRQRHGDAGAASILSTRRREANVVGEAPTVARSLM